MLAVSLPDTLTALLAVFAPCFTARTFLTFKALVAGFVAQPGQRTVTGMLTGAGLAGRRHHDLAYRFFATARWSADQVGLVLLDLICATLLPAGAPVVLAVDDTLWHRTGRKLHGVAWHHDGNGPSRHRPAWGHRWVVVGVIVHLPFLTRAVCLPVLARLWIPGERDHTPLLLARELVDLVCGHLGDHPVHLVGDAAYIGKPLRGLPKQEPHGPCGTARRWVKLGAGAACGRRFGLVLCA
jgi:DDE superfamily endonuclease